MAPVIIYDNVALRQFVGKKGKIAVIRYLESLISKDGNEQFKCDLSASGILKDGKLNYKAIEACG